MNEEIFGPILPVSSFESLEDVQNRGASAQRRLNDATAALERQNEKVAKSANKVSAAQKKVNDLKGDGTDIDAREALSLKRQMEKIADLTKKQEELMKKHKKHHTAQHMTMMRSEMNKGKTFTQAQKKAMEKVGK